MNLRISKVKLKEDMSRGRASAHSAAVQSRWLGIDELIYDVYA